MLGPSDVNKAKEEDPERCVTIALAAKPQHKVEFHIILVSVL